MTDPRQPHNQEAIDLAARFRLALEQQYQANTLPSLASIQDLIASSQALQPGSASNPIHIFDDPPIKSDPDQVDISPKEPRQLLEPHYIVSENPTHILRHQHPASGLGNSSPASSSQSRLFSASGSATASTAPSSSNLSAISGQSVLHNNSQTAPSRIRNLTVCSRCKQSGHVAKDHCSTCGETGHDSSAVHCHHCHRIDKCTTRYCVNTRCTRCNEIGHVASRHCQKCSLPTHGIWDHCHVCDTVGCHADKHCNVCEEVGHTSKDHCELCRDRGHTENDHCVKCKQLGHGFHECLESDPVSIELCWTCRNHGHHRDCCRYRQQDELRLKWAYQLNRKLMHAHRYCKCCREQGAPDRHHIKDCPKMTHRVGCLKKTHISPECIKWMDRSRKKGSYKDASTQADLAEYSTDVDPRIFDKTEEQVSVPTYHLPPNIFTVKSASTQTAFVKIGLDGEMDHHYEIDPMLLDEQPPIKEEIAEIDPAFLNEQSGELDIFAEIDPAILGEHLPIKQETTTLEEPEEESCSDDTVWRDAYWDDRVSQERLWACSSDMIMPTQNQQEAFEQAVMTPVIRRPPIDREERACGPSPEKSINPVVERPLTQSEMNDLRIVQELVRQHKERDLSEESDDLVIVDDKPPAPPDGQEGSSGRSPIRTFPETREDHVPAHIERHAEDLARQARAKAIDDAWYADIRRGNWDQPPMVTMTDIRDEHASSSINRHAEDSPEELEIKVVDASSDIQNGPCGWSPIRTFSEIRNDPVPPSIDRHAHEVNVAVASGSAGREKRPRKPTSAAQADNRDETVSGPNLTRSGDTSDSSQDKSVVLAERRQKSNMDLRSRLMAAKNTTQATVNHASVVGDVVASSSKVQDEPCGQSSVRTAAEHFPSSIKSHAHEPNAEGTSKAIGEKRPRQPTTTMPAEKRQRTTSEPNTSCPATNDNLTQATATRNTKAETTASTVGEKRPRRIVTMVLIDNRQRTTSDPKSSHPAITSNNIQEITNKSLTEGVDAPESNAEAASDDIGEQQARDPAPSLRADKSHKKISALGISRLTTAGDTAQASAIQASGPIVEVAPSTIDVDPKTPQLVTTSDTSNPTQVTANEALDESAETRQSTTSAPKPVTLTTTVNVSQGAANRKHHDRVCLDHELYIYWQDLCYVAIFDAPNQSTNPNQLHNLVSNWLRNCFPKHESIHNQADIAYLEAIMHSSPYIKTHKLKSASVETNPIQFSIHKSGITKVRFRVRVFTQEFARWKYQRCWKKYQCTDPRVKFRPRISFEHLIGMALHQADTEYMTADAIRQWISKNVAGYNCEGPDLERWVSGFREELAASSFFEPKGEDSKDWGFREGCGEFFDKRDPEVIFAVDPESLSYQACTRQPLTAVEHLLN